MPAAADRHVHIELSDPMAVLLRGVTAVRDLAWPAERIFPLADASETPSFSGPLIRAVGPMLTAPGGYPTADRWAPSGTGRELHGPEDAAAAVRDLAARGAAAIKVSLNAEAGPTPSDAELAAVADAAGAAGIPVTAHAQGAGEVERALGAGFDELAHTPWTHRLSDEVVRRPRSGCGSSRPWTSVRSGRDTPEIRTALENLRRFHTAGGTVIYGTGSGQRRDPARHPHARAPADGGGGDGVRGGARGPGPGADRARRAGGPARAGPSPLDDLEAFDEIRAVIRAGRVVTLR